MIRSDQATSGLTEPDGRPVPGPVASSPTPTTSPTPSPVALVPVSLDLLHAVQVAAGEDEVVFDPTTVVAGKSVPPGAQPRTWTSLA